MKYQILQGDNRQTLKTLADNSIDAIVTDPPYGIDFLGKSWDANTGALETYQECLRVLKPGGHILAFSAARTYHHLAVTLEQAGFEIRDQIMWIYSSGFPKSQDIGRQLHKQANGKPDKQRFDPAVMIKVEGDQYRHPDTGKIYRALPDINGDRLKDSHEGEKYGIVYEEIIVPLNTKTYMPNIDDNRNVANSTTGSPRCQMCDKSTGPVNKVCPDKRADCIKPWIPDTLNEWSGWGTALKPAHEPIALARKPVRGSIKDNVQTWGTGAINIDATRVPWGEGDDPEAYIEWMKKYPASTGSKAVFNNAHADAKGVEYVKDQDAEINADRNVDNRMSGRFPSNVIGEIADYQKYFYCPKVSRAERHIDGQAENNHPTVKPIELMKYLIKLITPPNGVVLDPFNGSGSTGCAAVELGFEYIGCELDPAYVKIAEQRIEAWYKHTHQNNFAELFQSM